MGGRKKIELKELREKHGLAIDPTDLRKRMRYERALDNLYAAGLKLEDTTISDVARGTAVKAAIDYADRVGGKAITPIEQTLNVVHKSAEEAANSILELLKHRKSEVAAKPDLVN